MSKFRKKPVVIEAFKWTGDQHQTEDPEWIIEAIKAGTVRVLKTGYMEIDTLEGVHLANPGDFIIQGVKGEIYPCKPDIFSMTYSAESVPGASTKFTTPENHIFRKEYRQLSDGEKATLDTLKDQAFALHSSMQSQPVECPGPSDKARCLAIAKTKLEESVMWAVKAITG